mgnify:CR=1 FL=1
MIRMQSDESRQAAYGSHPGKKSPLFGVVNSASEVARDLVELAELQIRLLKTDLSQALIRLILPIAVLLTSFITGLAAFCGLVIGLSLLLNSQSNLPLWASHLIVAFALLLLALLMMGIALKRLHAAVAILTTSSDELVKNVAWLKSIIRNSTDSST